MHNLTIKKIHKRKEKLGQKWKVSANSSYQIHFSSFHRWLKNLSTRTALTFDVQTNTVSYSNQTHKRIALWKAWCVATHRCLSRYCHACNYSVIQPCEPITPPGKIQKAVCAGRCIFKNRRAMLGRLEEFSLQRPNESPITYNCGGKKEYFWDFFTISCFIWGSVCVLSFIIPFTQHYLRM